MHADGGQIWTPFDTDTKIAERLGLAQTRYAAYTRDKHEPDLATLLRICRELQVDPNTLLAWDAEDGGAGEATRVRQQIQSDLMALDAEALHAVRTMTTALAAVADRRGRP